MGGGSVTLWVAAVCIMTLGLVNYVVAMYRSNIGFERVELAVVTGVVCQNGMNYARERVREGTALKHIHSNA